MILPLHRLPQLLSRVQAFPESESFSSAQLSLDQWGYLFRLGHLRSRNDARAALLWRAPDAFLSPLLESLPEYGSLTHRLRRDIFARLRVTPPGPVLREGLMVAQAYARISVETPRKRAYALAFFGAAYPLAAEYIEDRLLAGVPAFCVVDDAAVPHLLQALETRFQPGFLRGLSLEALVILPASVYRPATPRSAEDAERAWGTYLFSTFASQKELLHA